MSAPPRKPAPAEPGGLPRFTANDLSAPLAQRLAPKLRERYVVEREVGRGGAAYVFVAQDPQSGQRIAIKVLRPELLAPAGLERFQREIEIVRSLEHPNILPLLDFGSADGQHYFTMPFIEGHTLRVRIKKERQLKLRDTIRIARDIAKALDFAHAKGVIHRDIKPANVLLEGDRTIVADFGIARAMIVASGEEITPNSGIAIGTVEYMSPEQGEGHRELDGRSDIYALGCVVYEMLAGEPPFTGATAQAVVARHCHEAPRSIRVIRSAIPMGVERAVLKALAKVPADRFDSASAFVDALEDGLESRTDVFGLTRFTRKARYVVGTTLVAAAGSLGWYATSVRSHALDPNWIVVFPLNDRADPNAADGEDVATWVGYVLAVTRPLKWIDGWQLFDPRRQESAARLSEREAQRLSAKKGAAFFIDGSIVRRPDSVTVILRLHDVAGDSVLQVAGKTGAAAATSLPVLGADAVGALLPALLAPGSKVDVAALTNRRLPAIANFLRAERDYRRMRFRLALPSYQAALREDSAFTLAAFRGSYAANWISDFETATALAEIALQNRQALPLAQELLTRGLHAYLIGSADAAASYVRGALRSDSTVHAGWTLLAEISSRLLPNDWTADSVARDALERGRILEPDFAPTLLLLWEMALRSGDLKRVLALNAELQSAGADTTHAISRELMLRCVRDGPGSVDWTAAVRRNAAATLVSAKRLASRGAQPECAVSAFRALLDTTATVNSRWAAFLGLQTVLAATNRIGDGRDVFTWKGSQDLPLRFAHLFLASEGHGYDSEATQAANAAAGSYRAPGTPSLWALAAWESRQGNATRLRAIAQELRRRADSSKTRQDRLVATATEARLPLLTGDTATAIRLLRSLRPSASRAGIAWEPWESLGPERMLLAKLLLARREYDEVLRAASLLDATEPLTYPVHLRASLDLRARAAAELKNERLMADYRRRLAQLTRAAKRPS